MKVCGLGSAARSILRYQKERQGFDSCNLGGTAIHIVLHIRMQGDFFSQQIDEKKREEVAECLKQMQCRQSINPSK